MTLAISSCQWDVSQSTPPNITKDTLLYTYQTITQNKPNCKGKPDGSCFLIKIKYPVFKNNQLINDTVQEFIINHFLPDGLHFTNLSQSAKIYLSNYNKALTDAGLNKPEQVHFNIGIVRQDSSLLTIDLNDLQAHSPTTSPVPFDYYANFDVRSSHRIFLKDILVKNYQAALTKIADTIFRKEEKISDTTSLKNKYTFKDNAFTLSNNFLITPTGLIFLYNPMDIKPLNTGQTEISIPYSKIKSLLLPHTVISQYVK
jgi:hypothetical protein